MRHKIVIFVLVVITSIWSSEPKEIVGLWNAIGKSAYVKMEIVDGLVQGHVVKNSKDPKMIGVHLFQNLKWSEKSGKWVGYVYDYSKDKLWKGSFTMKSPDIFEMSVKFMGLGRSDDWGRVEEPL